MKDRFSVQQGIVAQPSLGLQEATVNLRVAAYNWMLVTLLDDERDWYPSCRDIWHFLHWPIDETPTYLARARDVLKPYMLKISPWHEFYDLLQFIARRYAQQSDSAFGSCNRMLEYEGSAYRFVGNKLAPIVTPAEATEVEKALASPVEAVGVHIADALAKLSQRPKPDLRNSIKESISAVESAFKLSTELRGGDLNEALRRFEKAYGALHPQFRAGVQNLYNFASDEKGIRHALLEPEANVDIDDARFMLIACSAFANFVVARSSQRPAS